MLTQRQNMLTEMQKMLTQIQILLTQIQKMLTQIQKTLTQIQMKDTSCLLSRYEGSHLTEAQSESGGAAQPPSQYSSICPQGNSIIITIILIIIVVIKVTYQTFPNILYRGSPPCVHYSDNREIYHINVWSCDYNWGNIGGRRRVLNKNTFDFCNYYPRHHNCQSVQMDI